MSCSCTSGNPRSFRVQHGWHVRPMKTGGFHGWKAHLKLLLWQGQSLQAWNVRNFMGLLLLSEKMKPKKHHKIHLKKIPHNCKVVRSSKSEGWAMFIPFKIFPPGFSRWHGTTKMHIKCQAIITPCVVPMTRHSGLEVLPWWRYASKATRPTCQKRAFLGALCTGRNWQTWRRDDLYLSYKV